VKIIVGSVKQMSKDASPTWGGMVCMTSPKNVHVGGYCASSTLTSSSSFTVPADNWHMFLKHVPTPQVNTVYGPPFNH